MSDETPPDPDDSTLSMFSDAGSGAPEADARPAYQVLARKYRPRRFEDLIGQEAMVRTLTNAFETGRIAHAFMLTGVRGVGKTTTARLLARGLNYRRDGADRPSVVLDPPGEHCEAIMQSRHPDVLELDAASRTGVSDMRELLDGVRYAPVSARYKVYIIDEVHMLSTAAFNALLKTLEEPPPHVKFVFATTEIRKVPVTVLSRCQRFDLKRLDIPTLCAHLGRIAAAEGASVEDEGLRLIARAAEGSVRDGLSILDQAIVQAPPGAPVSALQVRDMLGLADRARLLDAFEAMLSGDAANALTEIEDQVRSGADPLTILKEFLDITADASRARALGDAWRGHGPADWEGRILALAQRETAASLARLWRLILNGFQDAQLAPDTAIAVEMVVLRVSATAGLPPPEDAARLLLQGAPAGAHSVGQVEPGPADGPTSLTDLLQMLNARREVGLAYDVENHLRLESISAGEIRATLAEGGPGDLMRRLAEFLSEETGHPWRVEPADTPAATLRERAEQVRRERIAAAAADPLVAELMALFEGAEIIDVYPTGTIEETGAGANVVNLDTRRRKAG